MSTKSSLVTTRLLVVLCAFGGALAAQEDESGKTIDEPVQFPWPNTTMPEAYGPTGEMEDRFAHVWAWKDNMLFNELGLTIDNLNDTYTKPQADEWKPIINKMIQTVTGRDLNPQQEMKIQGGGYNTYNPENKGNAFNNYHRDNSLNEFFGSTPVEVYRVNIYVAGGEELMIGSNTIVPCTDLQGHKQRTFANPTSETIGDGPERYHPTTTKASGGGIQIDTGFKPRQTLAVNLKETPVVLWADADVMHRGSESANYRRWIDIIVTVPCKGYAMSEMKSNDQ